MAKKRSVSIETNDQNFGGSFNAHKNWKKLREKHRRVKKGEKFKPETWVPRGQGAGKGDGQRESQVPKEVYDLNFDLAFGRITKEEHEKLVKKFWEDLDS